MKYTGKAQEVGEAIINFFQTGDIVKPLKQVFFQQGVFPSIKYSFNNKFIIAMTGLLRDEVYSGAGGFHHWKTIGRNVKKGERAIIILSPLISKREDKKTGETIPIITGFKGTPVFAYEQTEGKDIELEDNKGFIESLPFIEVAQRWNIQVNIDVNSKGLGYYAPGKNKIGLAVKNKSTWCHELTHVADDKLNGLNLYQDSVQEAVAELGGAILLSIIGETEEADIGGCFEYIKSYSKGDKDKAVQLAMNVLDRTCKAVELIIDTAKELTLEKEKIKKSSLLIEIEEAIDCITKEEYRTCNQYFYKIYREFSGKDNIESMPEYKDYKKLINLMENMEEIFNISAETYIQNGNTGEALKMYEFAEFMQTFGDKCKYPSLRVNLRRNSRKELALIEA